MLSDTTIVHLIQQYQYPAIFIGTGFISEAVIIPASVLAKQGIFHWYTVYIVAWLATVVSDGIWFKGAKLILRVTHRLGTYEKKIHRLMHTVERMTGKRTYLFLFAYKFFYGFRSLTIIALSMRHYSFWKYMTFSAVGTAIWLTVIMSVGWLLGYGIDLLPAVHTFGYMTGGAILLVVIFKLITMWIGKEFAEEEEKIEAQEHGKK